MRMQSSVLAFQPTVGGIRLKHTFRVLNLLQNQSNRYLTRQYANVSTALHRNGLYCIWIFYRPSRVAPRIKRWRSFIWKQIVRSLWYDNQYFCWSCFSRFYFVFWKFLKCFVKWVVNVCRNTIFALIKCTEKHIWCTYYRFLFAKVSDSSQFSI